MKYLYLVLISILFIACSNENGSSGDPIIPADNFSRTNLLENLTNNIIVPAHINLQSKLENLNNKLENFTSNQISEMLEKTKKEISGDNISDKIRYILAHKISTLQEIKQ